MKDFIAFPKLNLEFGISDTIVQFQLFGINFSLKWYGLLIAIGFMLAVIYALRRAKHFDIDPDGMIDVTLVSALFAFIGARLYYVLFSEDRSFYFENPAEIIKVWGGGLAIYGGIILAFVTALWMCRLRKVNTLAMFDIASLGFLIGQGIGRWGNFFNQEAFGTNTELPWGMTGSIIQQGYSPLYDTSLPVHPTFLYESLWCALGFLLLHFFSKKAYKFKGQIFSLYIIWYGFGRFMIEGLRTDSLMLGATLRVSQVVAGLSVLGGIALYFFLRSRHNSLPLDLFETADCDTADDGQPTETQAEMVEDEGDDYSVDEIQEDDQAVEPDTEEFESSDITAQDSVESENEEEVSENISDDIEEVSEDTDVAESTDITEDSEDSDSDGTDME